MTQPGAKNMAYDEGLLDRAPQVSKEQRQEGYDADILNPVPVPAHTPPLAYNERPADVESGSSPHEKHLAAGGYDAVDHQGKTPFWKTPKGLIIAAAIALAAIAIAVGVGVGVTLSRHKDSSPTSSQNADSPATGDNLTVTTPTKTATQAETVTCRQGGPRCPATPAAHNTATATSAAPTAAESTGTIDAPTQLSGAPAQSSPGQTPPQQTPPEQTPGPKQTARELLGDF